MYFKEELLHKNDPAFFWCVSIGGCILKPLNNGSIIRWTFKAITEAWAEQRDTARVLDSSSVLHFPQWTRESQNTAHSPHEKSSC